MCESWLHMYARKKPDLLRVCVEWEFELLIYVVFMDRANVLLKMICASNPRSVCDVDCSCFDNCEDWEPGLGHSHFLSASVLDYSIGWVLSHCLELATLVLSWVNDNFVHWVLQIGTLRALGTGGFDIRIKFSHQRWAAHLIRASRYLDEIRTWTSRDYSWLLGPSSHRIQPRIATRYHTSKRRESWSWPKHPSAMRVSTY